MNRPALKYNGGKFRLREWILSHFPKHQVYVEMSCGASSVLLSKDRSKVEVANDLDGNITTFFSVLRDEPKKLIRKISLTPYSEKSLKYALETIDSTEDPIDRAWKFYTICWMSMRANDVRKSNIDFRAKGNLAEEGGHNPARLFSKIKHLYKISDRLRGVFILEKNAIELTKIYDSEGTLFYLDLPYLAESRNTKNLYTKEFSQVEQHVSVLETLTKIKGMAVVSHYPHPVYDEIFSGWEVVTKSTLANSMQKRKTRNSNERVEALYLSPLVSQNLHPTLFQEIAV
ncbi:unnamed protein product [Leptospira phage LE1]|uniref:Uncharacterized protein n=1 Tax=Leptospira phage LE1 TaxID=137511 RepID=Q6NDX5_9CAUD|nr:DNA methyltransferase [Leptospira phage LE1]CAE14770.1 unnamed protein product [Leptospira phage LE1]